MPTHALLRCQIITDQLVYMAYFSKNVGLAIKEGALSLEIVKQISS
jgi:hypothetical protein